MGLPLEIYWEPQNSAARLLTVNIYSDHIPPIVKNLHKLPAYCHAQCEVLVTTYESLNAMGTWSCSTQIWLCPLSFIWGPSAHYSRLTGWQLQRGVFWFLHPAYGMHSPGELAWPQATPVCHFITFLFCFGFYLFYSSFLFDPCFLLRFNYSLNTPEEIREDGLEKITSLMPFWGTSAILTQLLFKPEWGLPSSRRRSMVSRANAPPLLCELAIRHRRTNCKKVLHSRKVKYWKYFYHLVKKSNNPKKQYRNI